MIVWDIATSRWFNGTSRLTGFLSLSSLQLCASFPSFHPLAKPLTIFHFEISPVHKFDVPHLSIFYCSSKKIIGYQLQWNTALQSIYNSPYKDASILYPILLKLLWFPAPEAVAFLCHPWSWYNILGILLSSFCPWLGIPNTILRVLVAGKLHLPRISSHDALFFLSNCELLE